MPLFRKKPIVVVATRIVKTMIIKTRNGPVTGNPGEWLIYGIEGEEYPCDNGIFRKTYEPMDEQARSLLIEESDEPCHD